MERLLLVYGHKDSLQRKKDFECDLKWKAKVDLKRQGLRQVKVPGCMHQTAKEKKKSNSSLKGKKRFIGKMH